MIERIANVLKKHIETTDMPIGETMILQRDLGLSSLDMVNIIVDLEDEFGIEIPDTDIRRFVTVGDIERYLETRMH